MDDYGNIAYIYIYITRICTEVLTDVHVAPNLSSICPLPLVHAHKNQRTRCLMICRSCVELGYNTSRNGTTAYQCDRCLRHFWTQMLWAGGFSESKDTRKIADCYRAEIKICAKLWQPFPAHTWSKQGWNMPPWTCFARWLQYLELCAG